MKAIEAPILALGSARTSRRFLRHACGATDAELMALPEALPEALREEVLHEIVEWARAHPDGAVISLGDLPSVLHALAARRAPELPPLRGACLEAILAGLDKAWARARLGAGLGQPGYALLRAEHERLPGLPGAAGQPEQVMVKPLDGCASMGIHVGRTGQPTPPVRAPSGWLTKLRREHLGELGGGEVVGLVEAYVSAEVPRVSVDGWVRRDGEPIRFAISDNIGAPGEPERFDHQMYPTRLPEPARQACWALWEQVVARLVERHGLGGQCCDVEMFVHGAFGPEPRAEIMEINCRVHPNITPILRACTDAGDPIGAHLEPPGAHARRLPERAGGLFYIWSHEARPAPLRAAEVEALEGGPGLLACPFEGPGPRSGERTCLGWLYVFAEDPAKVRERGRDARARFEAMR